MPVPGGLCPVGCGIARGSQPGARRGADRPAASEQLGTVMALGQQIRNAIGTVWRVAVSAASQGQSAYNTISQALSSLREQVTTPILIDTSTQQQIASLAQGMEAARQAFGNAPGQAPVTSEMISLAPWSMDLNAFNANPGYQLQIGYQIPGNPETQYRVLGGVTTLPTTKQGVIDLALANAPALAGPEGKSPVLGNVDNATVDSVTITVAPALP